MFPAMLLVLVAALPAFAQTPKCQMFAKLPAKSESTRLIEYLRGTTGHTEACDLAALLRMDSLAVGGRFDPSWIDVLISYLDFKQPQPVVLGGGYYPYPAATALRELGEPAVPALLKVVADANASTVARANATDSISSILRGPKGIRTLVEASRTATDPGAAERLLDAAREASKFCASEKAACEAVLADRR